MAAPGREPRAAVPDELLVARAQAGDAAAMDAILDRFEGFAIWLTRGFYDHAADRADLHQEARIGIYKAVRDYKPGRGTTFASFATLCGRRQIYSYVTAATRGKHELLTRATRASVNDDGDQIAAADTVDDPAAEIVPLLERRADLAAAVHAVRSLPSPLERDVLAGTLNGEPQLDLQIRLGRPLSRWPDGRPRAKVVENALDRARAKIGRALEADALPLGLAACAQMREDAAAFRDATLIATSCAFDGCDWAFTGRADEGRAEARLHRAAAHADVAVFGKRCHVPGCDKRAKADEKACVAHANKPALREVAAVGERAGSGAASGTDLLRREPERAAPSPTAGPSAQITLDHLASGPRRVGELAALRGCSVGVIDQHVRALLAKGLIRRVSRGVYERLPEAA